MSRKFKIKFPKMDTNNLDQDEEFFYLIESDDKERKILFHEYAEIYKIAGLYEHLFYERLKCKSPSKVAEALRYIVSQAQDNFSELRVLDLGAGNGVMGEELKKYGCARLVGADIIYEAYEACERDRPTIYDAYDVVDFCNLFNILQSKGWIGFNIKETFLDKSDTTGFSITVRELIFSEYLDIYYLERYCHRLSMEGKPLYYFAIAGRKNADIPQEFLTSIGITA
jgi:SAM-dependent methyltransferase